MKLRAYRRELDAERQETLSFVGQPARFRMPPSTRYQGSKYKLLPWIAQALQDLQAQRVLDAFGGTGCVSYMFKSLGKRVTYNDHLRFNWWVGTALIANQGRTLSDSAIEMILHRDDSFAYDDFIERTFREVYFTEDENRWLDTVAQNIPRLPDQHDRALAYYALFQACIIKRPYNLFHRKNLYMRTAQVQRTFGNKASWDTSFPDHFRNFVHEVNASVFASASPCSATCCDARDIPGEFDLVYLDPPYINSKGIGVDYRDFYHFLEGLVDYSLWAQRVDYSKKHRPLLQDRSDWSSERKTRDAFASLFEKYQNSTIVVSYRSDGSPSQREIIDILQATKRRVRALHFGEYKYVLSKNGTSKELLLIGE